MDETRDILPPLDALVAALIEWGAIASQIVEHMWRSQQVTGETEPPIGVVLRTLLCGTLEPLAESREFELGVAARVVEDVTARVMDEIYLVPVEEFAPRNRAERRARRRRRG